MYIVSNLQYYNFCELPLYFVRTQCLVNIMKRVYCKWRKYGSQLFSKASVCLSRVTTKASVLSSSVNHVVGKCLLLRKKKSLIMHIVGWRDECFDYRLHV